MAANLDFDSLSLKYNDLGVLMRDETQREQLQEIVFTECARLLEEVSALKKEVFFCQRNLDLCGDIFRFLINSCVCCARNQLAILSTKVLKASLVVIEMICSPLLLSDIQVEKLKQTALQFLGNVIVGNEETQAYIWKAAFPKLFHKLLSYTGNQGKDLVCMLLLNCLRNRKSLFEDEDEVSIMLSVLDLCKTYQDAEWSMMLMEYVIDSGNFPTVYRKLESYSEQRSTLLELISAYLDDSSSPVTVPDESVCFVAQEWNHTTCSLSTYDHERSLDQDEIQLSSALLNTLCVASSEPRRYFGTTETKQLIRTAISALRYLSNKPSDATQPIVATSNHELLVGMRSDVVRLIGNLCYGVAECQNEVRLAGGIPMILECCALDDKNPYLMQWAVFAIRNLCEGNLENQRVIAGFEAQEVITDNYLERQGINMELKDGKLKVSRVPKQ